MTLTREETIERLKQNKAAAEYYAGQSQITAEIENALKDSEAFDMAIEALSPRRREEATEEDSAYCDDCEAVEMCMWYPHDGCQFKVSRSKGEWLDSGIGGAKVCSVCNAHMGLSSFNYCPSCGAYMRGKENE